MDTAGEANSRVLRRLISAVNLCWALWALLGGYFVLRYPGTLGSQSTLSVFHSWLHGYELIGISLLLCGIVSLLSMCFRTGQMVAAILCFVWCIATAVVIQVATPDVVDQGDVDAWLLVMCGLSCIGRWALLVMEPRVCE